MPKVKVEEIKQRIEAAADVYLSAVAAEFNTLLAQELDPDDEVGKGEYGDLLHGFAISYPQSKLRKLSSIYQRAVTRMVEADHAS